MVPIIVLAIFVLTLNLPFGYWRAQTRKFGFKWFLSIHIPVLIIISVRLYYHIGFTLKTLPITIFCFFAGQFIGGKLYFLRHPDIS